MKLKTFKFLFKACPLHHPALNPFDKNVWHFNILFKLQQRNLNILGVLLVLKCHKLRSRLFIPISVDDIILKFSLWQLTKFNQNWSKNYRKSHHSPMINITLTAPFMWLWTLFILFLKSFRECLWVLMAKKCSTTLTNVTISLKI